MTQNDTSLLLRAEELTYKNIKDLGEDKNKSLVRSATRSDEKPGDLPFTTWVITAEEILRNGYVTLADVLKAAPGIRVSQPGNAIEGETFMLRGLSGNEYVKILINDVPVKPSGALGMPIGAQLPIRAADRIEVLYGPSGGMIHGNEACAGVVNIIIKETERPIFTQADLGLGRMGYNSLDLTFGGKIFKGRNILRFSLFGNSTVRAQTDVFWDKNVLNAENYMVKGMIRNDLWSIPNYRGEADTSYQYALTSPAAHESRLFGIQMRWRGISFNYYRMSREDASFIGMSPFAVSYSTPGNFHKDKIDVYSISCWKRTEKAYFHSSWSLENYTVGNNSSATYNFDHLNLLSYIAQNGPQLNAADRQNIFVDEFFKYNFNAKFRYAKSLDLRWESYYQRTLWKKLWLTTGIQSGVHTSIPLLTRYLLPPENSSLLLENYSFSGPFETGQYAQFRANAYASLDWRGKKIRITAGAGNVIGFGLYTPRLGIVYRIDSTSAIYANASQGFKQIHPYQRTNTYRYDMANKKIVSDIYMGQDWGAEQFTGGELGYRMRKSEVSFFYQNSFNLIRGGYLLPDSLGAYTTGYYAAPGLSHHIWGGQLRLVLEDSFPVSLGAGRDVDGYFRTDFFMHYARGFERFGFGLPASGEIRNFPRLITQFRTTWRVGKFMLIVASNRQTEVVSKAVTYKDIWQRNTIVEKYPTFRTWDTMFRFYLNNNFVLYWHLMNVFDKDAYGLDAYGNPDDALLPLQPGRIFRFGINYNMN